MSEVQLVSKVFECADIDDFTELAYKNGWTDGLPVLPPTEDRKSTRLNSSH